MEIFVKSRPGAGGMKGLGVRKDLIFLLTLITAAVPAAAQGVSFQVSSVPNIVPLQDNSEPLGLISFTATTAGILKAGSTFSITYGVTNLLPQASATVACSEPSCTPAFMLTSSGNVATVTVANDVTLPAGALVCVFDFRFNATQFGVGMVIATVSAVSSAPSGNPITLTGSGQVQAAMVTAGTTAGVFSTDLSFGNQVVGASSQSRITNLTNFGTVPLNINSIVASPGVFTENNTCPQSLPPGQNCVITVMFTPTTIGALTAGSIAIADDAAGSPQIVTLTGIGVASGTGSTNAGSTMAQLASGGGWETLFTLVNIGTTPADAQLSFFDNNGNALSLPLTFPQSSATSSFQASSVNRTLAVGATLLIQSPGTVSQALQVGSAQLITSGNVSGFAIFRYDPTGQEALVPLETGNASAHILAFDNTNGLATGVAVANVSNQTANVPVILRDDTGALLGNDTIVLASAGHTSFVLTQNYAITSGRRGTMEFDTPSSGQIGVLGLRFTPTGAFSTIPALTK